MALDLIPLDEGEVFPQTPKRGLSFLEAIGNLSEPGTDAILRRLRDLQAKYPDKGYQLTKQGGEIIEGLPENRRNPVRYFAVAAPYLSTDADQPIISRTNFTRPAQWNSVTRIPGLTQLVEAEAPAINPGLLTPSVAPGTPSRFNLLPRTSAQVQPSSTPDAAAAADLENSIVDTSAADANDSALLENLIASSQGQPPPRQLGRQMITGSTNRMYNPVSPETSALMASLPRTMITGDSVRTYDRNTPSQFPPIRLPQARQVSQPPEFSELFKAIQPLQEEVTRITRYDPSNPPKAHTLTEQQYNALPPIMRSQYQAETERRHQMIQQAKERHDRLLANAEASVFSEHLSAAREKNRRDEESGQIAATDFVAKAEAKKLADSAFTQATKIDEAWQLALSDAKAKRLVSQSEKTGRINAITPESGPVAKQLNDDRIKIDSEMERIRVAKNEADAAFKRAEQVAAQRRQSTTPKASTTSTSTKSFGQFKEGQKIRRRDGTIWIVKDGNAIPFK